jgi:hypothetical protein
MFANLLWAMAAEVDTSALTIEVARLSFEYAIAAEASTFAFASRPYSKVVPPEFILRRVLDAPFASVKTGFELNVSASEDKLSKRSAELPAFLQPIESDTASLIRPADEAVPLDEK